MDDRTGSMNMPALAANDETDDRARAIRSEIDQTRDELSETVDAIQNKLRPGNLVSSAATATTDKVKDMAYNAADTAEEWWDASGGPGMMSHLRANPVPTALAAIGLAWLAFSDGRTGRRPSYQRGQTRAPYDRSDARESYESGVARRPQAGGYRGSYAGGDIGHDVSRMMRQGSRRVESMMHEYPLAVGAAAFIVGASLGMAVPETERENEMLGEARDNAVEKAQAAASNVVGQVKEAAADVVTRATIGD